MKQILLYFFLFFSSCCIAQSYTLASLDGGERKAKVNASIEVDPPQITVFPNPTADFVVITDKENVVTEVVFFNLLGKEVKSFSAIRAHKFDLVDLSKGLYLMQMKDATGNVLHTIRIKKV